MLFEGFAQAPLSAKALMVAINPLPIVHVGGSHSFSTIFVCSLPLCWSAYKVCRSVYENIGRRSIPILDMDSDYMAVECIEGCGIEPTVITLDLPAVVPSKSGKDLPVAEGAAEPEAVKPKTYTEIGNTEFVVSGDRVEVKQHRRIRKSRNKHYRANVLAVAKCRFGTPARDAAMLKAVRLFIKSLMDDDGIRPAQQRMYLPELIELVFVPDQHEIRAEELRCSVEVRSRKYLFDRLASRPWWLFRLPFWVTGATQ